MRIGYARVSTDEQNLDLQIDALKAAHCEKIFYDAGVSAVAPDRPQFKAALDSLEKGDTLVIWKMDRAFRSLMDALNILNMLEEREIGFLSLTDTVDTTTPMGRFAYQITNAFAELERALIVERTKAGMEAARRRGVRIGRPPKLNADQITHARKNLANGKQTIADIASIYQVSRRTIYRVISGKDT